MILSHDQNQHIDVPKDRKSWKRSVPMNVRSRDETVTGYAKGNWGIFKVPETKKWRLVHLPTGAIASTASHTLKAIKEGTEPMMDETVRRVRMTDEAIEFESVDTYWRIFRWEVEEN